MTDLFSSEDKFDFIFISEKYGLLAVGLYTGYRNIELIKKYPIFEKVDPDKFLDALFNILIVGPYSEDEDRVIIEERLDKYDLSKEDAERFSEQFLDSNDWLFEEYLEKSRQGNEQGLEGSVSDKKPIEFLLGLTSTEKLHFLFAKYKEKREEEVKSMFPFLHLRDDIIRNSLSNRLLTDRMFSRDITNSLNRISLSGSIPFDIITRDIQRRMNPLSDLGKSVQQAFSPKPSIKNVFPNVNKLEPIRAIENPVARESSELAEAANKVIREKAERDAFVINNIESIKNILEYIAKITASKIDYMTETIAKANAGFNEQLEKIVEEGKKNTEELINNGRNETKIVLKDNSKSQKKLIEEGNCSTRKQIWIAVVLFFASIIFSIRSNYKNDVKMTEINNKFNIMMSRQEELYTQTKDFKNFIIEETKNDNIRMEKLYDYLSTEISEIKMLLNMKSDIVDGNTGKKSKN